MNRFMDLDLDIGVVVKVDLSLMFNLYYNCFKDVNFCDVCFFGNFMKFKMIEEVGVVFLYGNQNIELWCWYNYNVWMYVL